ncbi:hypothetical protein BGZ60DRAFT_405791 [Tricladium varicosporioides]|nr:hypothetical protein BGZ60DRAFT_405791 [Hymenoscyphus varicosporioides]
MSRHSPSSSYAISGANYVTIGIDFGTTYSGVSWTWSKAPNPDQIEVVHKWEVGNGDARNQGADKVPSKICYNDNGTVAKWGYTVMPKDRNQAQWFKLLLSDAALEKECERVRQTRLLLRKLKKSPVDVAADYLRCLWTHAIEVIEFTLGKITVDNMAFRVVLTVPANWDDTAVELTRKAAVQAGITESRFRGETTLRTVSEPEAAALAAWREAGLQWRPDLQLNDSFVVCDAGGGTVDLISYTVKSLNPLKLEMCVEATGDLCGAVYLDEGFESHIRAVVSANVYDRLDPEVKAKVFEYDWEGSAKRRYNGEPTIEYKVDIPGYRPNRRHPFGRRPTSTIILHGGHVGSIFQPVVGRAVDLVNIQVGAVQDKMNKLPKIVLLVGGFGENNFLLNQLKATFPKVTIQRPMNAWSVISRGAVIKGQSTTAESDTVTNFISGRSYGIMYDSPWDPFQHNRKDKYRCPLKGIDMARNQFKWYLKRGDSVSKMQPVTYSWKMKLRNIRELENVHGTIWVSNNPTPPSRYDSSNAKKLCRIRCNFRSDMFYDLTERQAVDGSKYRELEYVLNMNVAAGELEWVITWRNQQRGRKQISVDYMTR